METGVLLNELCGAGYGVRHGVGTCLGTCGAVYS